jgi:hypothetical protein
MSWYKTKGGWTSSYNAQPHGRKGWGVQEKKSAYTGGYVVCRACPASWIWQSKVETRPACNCGLPWGHKAKDSTKPAVASVESKGWGTPATASMLQALAAHFPPEQLEAFMLANPALLPPAPVQVPRTIAVVTAEFKGAAANISKIVAAKDKVAKNLARLLEESLQRQSKMQELVAQHQQATLLHTALTQELANAHVGPETPTAEDANGIPEAMETDHAEDPRLAELRRKLAPEDQEVLEQAFKKVRHSFLEPLVGQARKVPVTPEQADATVAQAAALSASLAAGQPVGNQPSQPSG